MKKAMTVVMVLIFMFLTVAAGGAGEEKISSEEAFLAVLAEYRAKGERKFDVSLTEEYFESIRANGFAVWPALELRAGILSEDLRYNYSGNLYFENVVWGDRDWAECADEAEVFAAVSAFMEKKSSSFTILCSNELKTRLKDENLLFNYAARCGAKDLRFSYSFNIGLLTVKDIEYMDEPYAVAAGERDFLAAITAFAEEDVPQFTIVCEPDFYDELTADKERQRVLLATAPLSDYRSGKSGSFRAFYFSDVTYSMVPRVICRSEEDIVSAICQMGGIQANAFNLILTEELYETVRADGFKRLHQLEADAGMTSNSMSYDYMNYILYYTEAAITADMVRLTTPEEVMAYMADKAAQGEKEFTLFLTEELYERLMAGVSMFSFANDGMARIYDVTGNSGLYDYSFSYSSEGHYIQFHVTSWYPGTEIVNALARGEEDGLTGRVRETYQAAKRIAAECVADTPLQTAKNVHDRLCALTVYTDEESDEEHNTAIGAILNGQADCDGYADAFYLLGTLAGLEVRYQHGDSYDLGYHFSSFESVTHMWNLLKLDGTWRLVDVTWDDSEERGTVYTWFNIGQDRAERMHIWNQDMSAALDPATDLTARPENEYLVYGPEDAQASVRAALEAKQTAFELIWNDETGETAHEEILDFVQLNGPSAFRYVWNERMFTLTILGLEY